MTFQGNHDDLIIEIIINSLSYGLIMNWYKGSDKGNTLTAVMKQKLYTFFI